MDIIKESDVLSFTVDDSGSVLELTAMDSEGELYYRDNGVWVELNATDDYPTIYDQDMLDILPEERETALEFWDSAQVTDLELVEDNIISFTTLSR